MFKNKRAQEKFLSGFNVVVWLILAVVIIVGVSLFNNFSTDARISESRALNQKIIDCIIEDTGELIENFNETFSIYETCGIREDLFEKEFVLGARIELFSSEEEKPDITLHFGSTEMIFLCDLTGEAKPDNCFSEIAFVNDKKENRAYQIKVLTASNHNGKEITGSEEFREGGSR